jgi:hypothetical protein
MSNIKQDHELAMEYADQADAAKLRGEVEQATSLFRQSLEYERRAATAIATDLNAEPTRSVLHRSAASLALLCGESREAERLICVALSGNPPTEIAEELRDLLETIYSRRTHNLSAMSVTH